MKNQENIWSIKATHIKSDKNHRKFRCFVSVFSRVGYKHKQTSSNDLIFLLGSILLLLRIVLTKQTFYSHSASILYHFFIKNKYYILKIILTLLKLDKLDFQEQYMLIQWQKINISDLCLPRIIGEQSSPCHSSLHCQMPV